MRHRFHLPKSIDTYVTIDGVEMEVRVFFDYQPEEAQTRDDPGCEGSVDITSAYYEDQGCILSEVSNDEIDALADRVWEKLGEGGPE